MSTGKWRSSTMVRIGTSCCPPPARDGRADVATVSVTVNLVWGGFWQGGARRAFPLSQARRQLLTRWRLPWHRSRPSRTHVMRRPRRKVTLLRQLIRLLNGRAERGVAETKRVVDDVRHGKPEQVILLRRTAVGSSS